MPLKALAAGAVGAENRSRLSHIGVTFMVLHTRSKLSDSDTKEEEEDSWSYIRSKTQTHRQTHTLGFRCGVTVRGIHCNRRQPLLF